MRPEDYWIARGEDVIGLDVLRDGEQARQAATYQAIAEAINDWAIFEVLDVGCNIGALYDWLFAFSKFDYLGIDTNIHAIQIARKRGLYAGIGNLCYLPYSDRFFDCVVVKDVIEHLENIEPLREAFRVAAEYAILSTYLPWHDAPSRIVQHPDGYYTNTYNRQDVIDLARECGFELVETIATQETNGTPNEVTVWARR